MFKFINSDIAHQTTMARSNYHRFAKNSVAILAQAPIKILCSLCLFSIRSRPLSRVWSHFHTKTLHRDPVKSSFPPFLLKGKKLRTGMILHHLEETVAAPAAGAEQTTARPGFMDRLRAVFGAERAEEIAREVRQAQREAEEHFKRLIFKAWTFVFLSIIVAASIVGFGASRDINVESTTELEFGQKATWYSALAVCGRASDPPIHCVCVWPIHNFDIWRWPASAC